MQKIKFERKQFLWFFSINILDESGKVNQWKVGQAKKKEKAQDLF